MTLIKLTQNGKEYYYNGWYLYNDGNRYPNYITERVDAIHFYDEGFARGMKKYSNNKVLINYTLTDIDENHMIEFENKERRG